jgi:hypothetical protein
MLAPCDFSPDTSKHVGLWFKLYIYNTLEADIFFRLLASINGVREMGATRS